MSWYNPVDSIKHAANYVGKSVSSGIGKIGDTWDSLSKGSGNEPTRIAPFEASDQETLILQKLMDMYLGGNAGGVPVNFNGKQIGTIGSSRTSDALLDLWKTMYASRYYSPTTTTSYVPSYLEQLLPIAGKATSSYIGKS